MAAEKTFINDPHLDTDIILRFPTYATREVFGERAYPRDILIKLTKGYKRITPFTRKDLAVKIFSYKVKEEEKAGLIRFLLYEVLEIRWRSHLCRIFVGTRETIMTKHDSEHEYNRCLNFDLHETIRVMRRACLEGLLPSDLVNEEVNEWIEWQ